MRYSLVGHSHRTSEHTRHIQPKRNGSSTPSRSISAIWPKHSHCVKLHRHYHHQHPRPNPPLYQTRSENDRAPPAGMKRMTKKRVTVGKRLRRGMRRRGGCTLLSGRLVNRSEVRAKWVNSVVEELEASSRSWLPVMSRGWFRTEGGNRGVGSILQRASSGRAGRILHTEGVGLCVVQVQGRCAHLHVWPAWILLVPS